MTTDFLHGIEVLDIDSGPRPISTVRASVIGLIGTAPDADPTMFPLNKPVLIAGNRLDFAKIDTTGDNMGTLPQALDDMFDQTAPVVVVIRVDQGLSAAATLANILGGVNSVDGTYDGLQAFLAAESILGVRPRILCAPGFTGNRVSGALTSVVVTVQGTGYTSAPTVTFSGGGSASTKVLPTGHAVLGTGGNAGNVVSVIIDTPGQDMTVAPTIAFSGGGGSSAAATAAIGVIGNAVVSEMLGIAQRMRAVIIADGPNTTDAAAIAYAGDFGDKRVYVVDPGVVVQQGAQTVSLPASARVAGLIAKTDNDLGFWWSPSNQEINGIVGTSRAVDFVLGDANCRANLLNESNVATIIRQNGFRLWGNRTLSSDPKWAFLSVVRTADIINDSLLAAHLWAVDRGITRTYVQDVREGVRAFLRSLVAQGAILGGDCWIDPALNTPDKIAQGHVTFDFDFTPVYPAERLTFRSHLVNDFIQTIFDENGN